MPPVETEYIRAFFFSTYAGLVSSHHQQLSIVPPRPVTLYSYCPLQLGYTWFHVPLLCVALHNLFHSSFLIYFVQVFTQFTDFVQDKQTYTDILFQSQSPDIYTAFAAVLRTVGYGVHCHLRAWLPARSVGLPTSSLTCL